MAQRVLSSGESGSQFAALKKEFLFHEKRMQLLLSSSAVEGFSAAINEKLTTRDECAEDCRTTLKKLSEASQMPSLSGKWNESVVASVLQLNIPLRDVIGSQLFEETSTAACEDLKDIIKQLSEQSQEHAEFQISTKSNNSSNNNNKNTNNISSEARQQELVESLLKSIDATALSARDVKRMREAVKSKLQVITELTHLSDALQKSGFQLAQERSDVCRLQEQEDQANDDGEVAVSETLVEQRISALEKIIDIIFFRLHTVDATIDTNVTKRHSNLQALQHTTVALEGIKREKQDVFQNCQDDIRRIDRSLQLQHVKEQTDSKGAELLAESEKKFLQIENKRVALSQKLQELGSEFIETERALAKLGVERAVAIDRHLDLVEQSRHVAADFAEMARFATSHRKNLEVTREKSNEGLDSVSLLERLLLQETDYMQYNFRASAQRLQHVREGVADELRSSLRDYEITIGEMLRRKQEIVLGLDEQIRVAECESELRKDLFDPTAKKFVDKQRNLEIQRKKVIDEMCQMSEKLGQQISSIKSKLGEEFVSEIGKSSSNINNSSSASAAAVNTLASSQNNNENNNNSSSPTMYHQRNEAKALVAHLRAKVQQEMSQLEASSSNQQQQQQQQQNTEYVDPNISSRQSQNRNISNLLLNNTNASSSATSPQHFRNVVDGVTRVSEDEDLHQRNIRKHERLLDNRQTLLDVRNPNVTAIEARKELSALQQSVESSIGVYHQQQKQQFREKTQQEHLTSLLSDYRAGSENNSQTAQQQESSFEKKKSDHHDHGDGDDESLAEMRKQQQRDNLSLNTGNTSSGFTSSSSRAQAIRDEIRKAKNQASSLFSPSSNHSLRQQQQREKNREQQEREQYLKDSSSAKHLNSSSSSSQQQQQQQNRSRNLNYVMEETSKFETSNDGLAQVLVSGGVDDDDDGGRRSNNNTAAGSAARAVPQRRHPRVIR